MPLFVSLDAPATRYCLYCPGCRRRYELSISEVTVREDSVVIDYYCTGCHGPQQLTINGDHMEWSTGICFQRNVGKTESDEETSA